MIPSKTGSKVFCRKSAFQLTADVNVFHVPDTNELIADVNFSQVPVTKSPIALKKGCMTSALNLLNALPNCSIIYIMSPKVSLMAAK